jgi:YVTN family beta-propeller protein
MPIRSGLKNLLLGGLLAFLASSVQAADPAPPLTLEQTIPLHNVSGRIDHMAVDLDRKRVFVAELGNGTVDVVDLATATVIHRIGGLHEPQGIGYAPARDVVAVASAGDGSVRFFNGGDFAPAGVVELGEDADNQG